MIPFIIATWLEFAVCLWMAQGDPAAAIFVFTLIITMGAIIQRETSNGQTH